MQFKRHLPHPSGQAVSVLPVPVGGSDSLSPAVFWPCRPSGTLQNFRVVEGTSPEECCQIPGTDPAGTGPTRAAACFLLGSMAVKGNSQQEITPPANMSAPVYLLYSMSSSYPLLCMAALTGITITMWVLWVWSCIKDLWVKHHSSGAGSMQEWH